MKRIVLLRHGESVWNKENLFTGWTDVDLSEHGVGEARQAGRLLADKGFEFDCAFTSLLKRAVRTLDIVLREMDLEWIPVAKSWRLNEKHYGALQGLNKSETAQRYGEEQVHLWRRGFDTEPPALADDDPRNPRLDPRYSDVPPAYLPLTESLKDTIARTMPYWNCHILPALMHCDTILVAAHGNSLRGIVKSLKDISDEDISGFNIPTATPYVFEFDSSLRPTADYFLGNADEIARRQTAVAAQGSAKG